MPPDGAVLAAARPRRHPHAVTPSRLSVVDVAMFYARAAGASARTWTSRRAIAREKGVYTLLAAAAGSAERWPLVLIGGGHAVDAARALARRFSWERAFAAELRDLERLVR